MNPPIVTPLRRGDASPALIVLRRQLLSTGLQAVMIAPEDVNHPELFDDHLDTAVRAFQQNRGLLVDGVLGASTLSEIDQARWSIGDRILRFDPDHEMRGDDVAHLQERLRTFGVYSQSIDGVFDAATDSSLRQLQTYLGVTADGVLGPDTLAALQNMGRAIRGGNLFALHENARVARSGASLAGKYIVIGYGGEPRHDAAGESESDITRDVANRLEGRLLAVGAGAIKSPTDDLVSLRSKVTPDLFISLRTDSWSNPAASGVASFYYGTHSDSAPNASPIGSLLARYIQSEITHRTDLTDLHTHARTWHVLVSTHVPTVQVSLGYLSNEHDRRRLVSAAFRDTLAEAILVAIQRLYLGEDDSPTGSLDVEEIARLAARRG